MLNRRFLRIKAMQSLYALDQCRQSDYFLAIDQITEFFQAELEMEPSQLELEEVKQLFKRSVLEGSLVSNPGTSPEVQEATSISLKFYQDQTQIDFDHLYGNMVQAADRVENYYFSLLDLLIRWSELAELGHSKKSINQDPMNSQFRLNLFRNKVISLLRESIWLRGKKKIPAWSSKGGEAHRWFKDIVRKDQVYHDYELQGNPTFEQDHAMVTYLIKKVIFKSAAIQSFMEETDINWEEDAAIVKSVLLKTVKAITEDQDPSNFEIPGISYNWEEDRQFFHDLFKTTVERDKEFANWIALKAKNWEMERIAALDKIILKMALSEMINFPSIPIKVTINEYIEISKLYSTPKSRHFINGILDVLAKELQKKGVIKKSGRGLIDNK